MIEILLCGVTLIAEHLPSAPRPSRASLAIHRSPNHVKCWRKNRGGCERSKLCALWDRAASLALLALARNSNDHYDHYAIGVLLNNTVQCSEFDRSSQRFASGRVNAGKRGKKRVVCSFCKKFNAAISISRACRESIPPPRRSLLLARSIDSSADLSLDHASPQSGRCGSRDSVFTEALQSLTRHGHASRALCFPATMECHNFDIGDSPLEAMRELRLLRIVSFLRCIVKSKLPAGEHRSDRRETLILEERSRNENFAVDRSGRGRKQKEQIAVWK